MFGNGARLESRRRLFAGESERHLAQSVRHADSADPAEPGVAKRVMRGGSFTRLDAFILASSILVFLSLIEVMLTTKLATNNRTDLARLMDRHCRIAFPARLPEHPRK